MSSYGFLSMSPSPVLVARVARAMWEMKRGLCFPVERKSWIWISLGSGELLFCIALIIFPLRACLCLHIFPLRLCLRRLNSWECCWVSLFISCSPSSSCNVVRETQSQHPTFLMPIFRSESDTKCTAQTSSSVSHWSRKDCGKTLFATVSHSDAAINNRDRIHGSVPTRLRVGRKRS